MSSILEHLKERTNSRDLGLGTQGLGNQVTGQAEENTGTRLSWVVPSIYQTLNPSLGTRMKGAGSALRLAAQRSEGLARLHPRNTGPEAGLVHPRGRGRTRVSAAFTRVHG